MIKDILIILLTAMIFILGFYSCNLELEGNTKQKNLIEVLLENENLKKTIDSKNREITEVKAIVVNKDKDIQNALKEIDRLKSLDTKVVFRTKTKYDTLIVVLRDTTIIYNTDTIKSQKFDYSDNWLSMSGLIEQDSIVFDSLLINNQYSIEIGNIRKGLFKRQKVAFITNENPYSKTTQAQTFILQEEKKWYQRDVTKIGLSSVGTYFILRAL